VSIESRHSGAGNGIDVDTLKYSFPFEAVKRKVATREARDVATIKIKSLMGKRSI
jgi:hypothetical protein